MELHRRPPSFAHPPDPQRPWARDRIEMQIEVVLPWRDRLRALLRGRIVVFLGVSTERRTGRYESDTSVRVPKVFFGK